MNKVSLRTWTAPKDGSEGDYMQLAPVVTPDYHPIIASPDSPVVSNYLHNYKLRWVAQYADRSVIAQFDADGERSADKIPREGLRKFLLMANDKIICSLDLKVGRSFFYRRRTALKPGESVVEAIHILGWREQDIICVLFVYESDLHVECGEFYPLSKQTRPQEWRYPIEWHEADLVLIT